jgi:hypothetical protein
MTGNVRVRKSWDTSGGCCGGAAIAAIKKILRGHMVVLPVGIIVPDVTGISNPKWEALLIVAKKNVTESFASFHPSGVGLLGSTGANGR